MLFLVAAASVLAAARAEDSGSWPEKGPVREGRTLAFPTLGIRWTLPDDSPLSWSKPIEDESKGEGALVKAVATSGDAAGQVTLRADPSELLFRVDMKPTAQWIDSVGGMVSAVDTARTESKHSVPMGNVSCQYVRKWGTYRGRPGTFQAWVTYRQGIMISVQASHLCNDVGEAPLAAAVEALVATIRFDDRKPWVVGPATFGGTTSADRRDSSDLGKSVEVTFFDRKIRKPAELSSMPFDAEVASKDLCAAWETWSTDRTAYFCAFIEAKRAVRSSPQYPQLMADAYEKYWKENIADAETVRKGKQVGPKVTFGKVKGLGYEFRGRFCGAPYVQRGFIGEHKGILYSLHFQYGGDGAEEQFGPLRDKVRIALGL